MADSVDEAVKAVRYQIKARAQVIKFSATAAVLYLVPTTHLGDTIELTGPLAGVKIAPRPGAPLMAVPGNPLENIHATEKAVFARKGGKVHQQPCLTRQLYPDIIVSSG